MMKSSGKWIALSLILAAIAVISDIGGAYGAVRDFYNWATNRNRSEVSLALFNMDTEAGIEEGTSQTKGVNLVTLQAVVGNDGDRPLWAMVGKAEANLADKECEKDAVVWQKLKIPPGISTLVTFCNIDIPLLPGQARQGRVDLRIKYGEDADRLDKELLVKGSFGVQAKDVGGRVTWLPDADSALPRGQVPRSTTVAPNERPLEAVMNDASNL